LTVILRVIAVGKLKDPGLQSSVDTYIKRSRAFAQIEFLVVKDMASLRSKAGDPRVVLDERGEQLTTMALAEQVRSWRDGGRSRVDFLVGDAHGFDERDREQAQRVVALSRMTMPHRIAQLLLVEQLYRVGTILSGHPYHHA
jgi:23S rRNA (pseudouridine1915-N3)-methyltransferase